MNMINIGKVKHDLSLSTAHSICLRSGLFQIFHSIHCWIYLTWAHGLGSANLNPNPNFSVFWCFGEYSQT